jgi:diaminohydroxyphosphoribosylaminopyrimidine deaminase/5-amino-6-(5-phosphoribosylamino)uracil reductase
MAVTDQTTVDVQYMQQALDLARGGLGLVSPNPLVGCVIVNEGAVVGRGFHQRFGGPHAEVHALQDAGTHARGAVLYVNLEPCSHTGKTPPCADAVIKAGVSRVVAALRDPNPLVAGQGLGRVAAAGIAVMVGVCEDAARKLNEAFIKHITTRRPFVTLKSAITLDGKIATRTGASQWITGEDARREGHRLRHAADAILVGLGTVLQDNPQLTTRLPDQQGVNPLRVIVDSTLQVPLHAQVVDVAPERRTLIATTERAPTAVSAQLQARGVEVVRLPAYDDGRVDLDALCGYLGERGIASVLVEGGAMLSATLLQRRLVDKVLFFVAPKIIGGDGLSAVGSCGVEAMEQIILLQDMTSRRVGDDVLLEAYLTR